MLGARRGASSSLRKIRIRALDTSQLQGGVSCQRLGQTEISEQSSIPLSVNA